MYIKLVEIPEGWRGAIFVFKKWKFRGGGGDLCEIPSVVPLGVWIFSGTTHSSKVCSLNHFVPDLNESLARRDTESGSPTDDDFQPAKKRFRTPGNQVNYKRKWTKAG